MPIKYYTVAEDGGTLTIGAVGSAVDYAAQVRSATVKWSKNSEDSLPTLSGEELSGGTTYTATLDATLIQDLTEDGLVEWTWTHKGDEVPFTYVPSAATGRAISGTVVVDPIDVGGDVKAKAPTSDISWACVGEPTIGTDLT